MNKKDARTISGCSVLIFGIGFIVSAVGVILSLVTGSDLLDVFIDRDGDSFFGWWKAKFWIAVVAIIVFLLVGGKFKNLRLLDGFPYKEDEEKNKS